MKQKLSKLIDLKTIVTLSLTAAFIYGFIVGKITTEEFMTIFAMVVAFYFSKKTKGSEDNE